MPELLHSVPCFGYRFSLEDRSLHIVRIPILQECSPARRRAESPDYECAFIQEWKISNGLISIRNRYTYRTGSGAPALALVHIRCTSLQDVRRPVCHHGYIFKRFSGVAYRNRWSLPFGINLSGIFRRHAGMMANARVYSIHNERNEAIILVKTWRCLMTGYTGFFSYRFIVFKNI